MSAKKSLSKTNTYLKSSSAKKMRIRSIASSTAIETNKPITEIEAKIKNRSPSDYRVKLA